MNRELSSSELKKLNSKKGLISILSKDSINVDRTLRYIEYERKLVKLQIEVIKLQTWAINNNERIIILFEGRDAAGKGGAIRRITERINPRHIKIVALPKPTEDEQTQWYFQRYIEQFPKAGEMVFFNRSWYNRAVLEPVNGFCSDEQYTTFMGQVNDFERMILESGIHLVKIYMSISKKEQAKRDLVDAMYLIAACIIYLEAISLFYLQRQVLIMLLIKQLLDMGLLANNIITNLLRSILRILTTSCNNNISVTII